MGLLFLFKSFPDSPDCSVDPNRTLVPVQSRGPVQEPCNFRWSAQYSGASGLGFLRIGERLNRYDLIGFQETFFSHAVLLEKNEQYGRFIKERSSDHIFYRSGKNLPMKPLFRALLKEEFSIRESGPLSVHHPLRGEFELSTQ